ncbi:MAG TPA: OmpA family protein [Candidatus Angelobacter sp.]|nr:OmpA family protein [Candidatus Angelobacter sp.]
MKNRCIYVALLLWVGAWSAMALQQTEASAQQNQPTYRVTMVPRTITAINYEHRQSSKIDFQGSPLLPLAKGVARVTGEQGRTAIDAEFTRLESARKFGPEYLTYVLWAITPEGKTNNLGELLLDGDRSKLKVTTPLQTFGLIVTAEPYYAVSEPSDAVIMENVVRTETRGTAQPIRVNYRSFSRGQYSYDVASASQSYPKSKVPLEIEEARNAIEIAKAAGAQQYASDPFIKANTSLAEAESILKHKGDKKKAIQSARDAVQNAADAQRAAIKRAEDEQAAAALAAETQRTARAQADAADAAAKQQQEQATRQQAEQRAAQELAARQEAEQRAQQEQAERQRAEQQAQMEAQKAQQEQQAASEAQQASARAEQEKQQLRANLLQQFNRILPTTDTPRGLKVNLADVLFETGKYDLQATAREALAKLSGIVASHPGLKLQVEGYTDIVGDDAYNLTLSENRANSVRAYLVNQGVDPSAIAATGYGKSNPVANNDTAWGKQQNRRVEIIISGEIIGMPIGR